MAKENIKARVTVELAADRDIAAAVVVEQLPRLEQYLLSLGPLGIAVSGGVDSMTLAYIAHRVDPRSVMFHALSAAVPEQASVRVKTYAQLQGWNLELINAGEMQSPEYVKNPINRCYFCKSNLYQSIGRKTGLTIISGTNTDDLDDFRPGLAAAKELGVCHPYVEIGIDKQGVRALAQHFSLHDLQSLPASPCLSSRISTGIAINEKLLVLIDRVENKLSELLNDSLSSRAVRCRVFPNNITIQLESEQNFDHDVVYGESIRQMVKEVFTHQGFKKHLRTIRIEPYSRGSAFIHVKNLNVEN